MSGKLSTKSKLNNSMNEARASSEGFLHSRCPISEEDWPGQHQTTADRRTTRRKWSQEENIVVMQCYYRSEYGRNGCTNRMHVIWNEMGMFNVTEQDFVDRAKVGYQKNTILKRKWLSDSELEEIQRNIENIRNGEVRLESDEDEGQFLGFD